MLWCLIWLCLYINLIVFIYTWPKNKINCKIKNYSDTVKPYILPSLQYKLKGQHNKLTLSSSLVFCSRSTTQYKKSFLFPDPEDKKPSLILVRFYPGVIAPPSKFSENTTEKDLREFKEGVQEEIKNIKDRDSSDPNEVCDRAQEQFNKAKTVEDLDKLKEDLDKERLSNSAKYLEERREDLKEIKAKIEESSFTDQTKKKELEELDKEHEDLLEEEGKVVKGTLEAVNEAYAAVRRNKFEPYYGISDMSSVASFGSDSSEEKRDVSGKSNQFKQDTKDLELQSTEPTSITDLDGGD